VQTTDRRKIDQLPLFFVIKTINAFQLYASHISILPHGITAATIFLFSATDILSENSENENSSGPIYHRYRLNFCIADSDTAF
jgi:predicted NACHT family NTPase